MNNLGTGLRLEITIHNFDDSLPLCEVYRIMNIVILFTFVSMLWIKFTIGFNCTFFKPSFIFIFHVPGYDKKYFQLKPIV